MIESVQYSAIFGIGALLIGRHRDTFTQCQFAWTVPALLTVYITDIYLGGLRISFAFKGDEIGIFMTKQAEWFLDEYEGFVGGKRL